MAEVSSRRRKRGSATSDHDDSRAVSMASVRKALKPNSADVKALQHGSAPSVDEHPSSRAAQVPTIFLSHSGNQKSFVEYLYNALQSANHSPFFDKHSLPKGSRFPPHIEEAARGCKLGVVVLSEGFLTSKWPMLELEILYSKPDAKVFPIFYKLSPDDLKCPENLSRWGLEWKEMKAGQDVKKWEEVVKRISSYNGEIYERGKSKITFLKKVVVKICELVPSPVSQDLSSYQGHQRLAQEVARQFEEALARNGDHKVCMVGLYGVGGLGKTTICKIMCDSYMSEYLGRSCHIEFPSDGDRKMIVKECQKALKKLTNLSDEHVLNKADNFDRVIQLMRENLGPPNEVFLAIDNVWESSLEEAKRILEVNFSINSKILLTSRSDQVLKDLGVRSDSNITVAPLPSPDHDEAFQIFQDTFGRARSLKSLVLNTNLLDSVLRRCFFSGKYHPLALIAVGRYVQRACDLNGLNKIEDILSRILQEIVPLNQVEELIQFNYGHLAVEKQHMFLDIVVVLMDESCQDESGVTCEKAIQWLHILYKKNSSIKISNLIYELALNGLIQLEPIIEGRAEKMITVHDLYYNLAQKEAAGSARFIPGQYDLIGDFARSESPESVEEIQWESLERVMLSRYRCGEATESLIQELQQHQCPKLQVLTCGEDIDLPRGIQLDLMPSLCVLILYGTTLRSIKNWSAATGLAIVQLEHVYFDRPLEPIPRIPCLEDLVLENVEMEGPPNVAECQHLKKLVLFNDALFKLATAQDEASGLNSPANNGLQIQQLNVNALVNLQLLRIGRWGSIERIEGLDALKNLQRFHVEHVPYQRNLDSLSGLLQLEHIHIENTDLKKMPDLSGLTSLERLKLWDNESMEEVGGLSPALKHVEVNYCKALKRTPDLSGLTCLERLVLGDNESMEEVVGGLSPALKHVEVSLKRMPNLSGLTCLERLVLQGDESMEEVVGGLCPALKHVTVENCKALKRMPDLSGLTCLKSLDLQHNESMEEVGGLSPALKHVEICGCQSLKRMPDLSGLSCLETLVLRGNESMEEVVGGLSPALKRVDVDDCKALKRMPDLSGLTCLERLYLRRNKSMEEVVGGLSPALKDVEVSWCHALKRMPDLSGLTCLESLCLSGNESMEEVGGENLSSTLRTLAIGRCRSLRRFPSWKESVHLNYLEASAIWWMGSLQKLPNLWYLHVVDGEGTSIERVISGVTSLQSLAIIGYDSLLKLDVECLPCSLKYLRVSECRALEEIGDLSALLSLQKLHLESCPSLKKLGGLCMQNFELGGLWLDDCESLEDRHCLAPALRDRYIRRLSNVKIRRDSGFVTL